ncbi:hypothetical protein GCM10010841_31630 [Deinococcus aerophilus]|uniref:Transposase n=1 Tax=Deinococcus aerophilus TaxID=522488 RepID=A0ABQ2H189_9DEIO|nr:hypothetical protein GCM10010841_31630 [Deinococcus aerophilus]
MGAQRVEDHLSRQDNPGRAMVSQVRFGWQVLGQATRWGGEVLRDCLQLLSLPFPPTNTSIP